VLPDCAVHAATPSHSLGDYHHAVANSEYLLATPCSQKVTVYPSKNNLLLQLQDYVSYSAIIDLCVCRDSDSR
jgi:hypothetical protein